MHVRENAEKIARARKKKRKIEPTTSKTSHPTYPKFFVLINISSSRLYRAFSSTVWKMCSENLYSFSRFPRWSGADARTVVEEEEDRYLFFNV